MGTRSDVRSLVEYRRRGKTWGVSRVSIDNVWAPRNGANILAVIVVILLFLRKSTGVEMEWEVLVLGSPAVLGSAICYKPLEWDLRTMSIMTSSNRMFEI